jgi:hypothetical protein
MLPFAAMANSRAYEEFSRRLRQALQEAGEGDGPTHLARQFNARYSGKSVTQQAARKWLHGEALPAHDKIKTLAAWLGVGSNWLEYGEEGGHAAQQAATTYRSVLSDQELVRYYHKLNRSQQQALAEIIAALAAKDRRR